MRWLYYAVAIGCMVVAVRIVNLYTWQYIVSSMLFTLAGGLIWKYTEYKPKPKTKRKDRGPLHYEDIHY